MPVGSTPSSRSRRSRRTRLTAAVLLSAAALLLGTPWSAPAAADGRPVALTGLSAQDTGLDPSEWNSTGSCESCTQ